MNGFVAHTPKGKVAKAWHIYCLPLPKDVARDKIDFHG